MTESRLRQFGHVKRRNEDTPVKICEMINLPECKKRRVLEDNLGKHETK